MLLFIVLFVHLVICYLFNQTKTKEYDDILCCLCPEGPTWCHISKHLFRDKWQPNTMVLSSAVALDNLVLNPGSAFTGCVIWGKLLKLSVFKFFIC